MGLEKVEILSQIDEKEGGIVGAITKPVDDRIDDPKLESNQKHQMSKSQLKVTIQQL